MSVLLNQLRYPAEVREEQKTIEVTTVYLYPDIAKSIDVLEQVLNYTLVVSVKVDLVWQVVPQDSTIHVVFLNVVVLSCLLSREL